MWYFDGLVALPSRLNRTQWTTLLLFGLIAALTTVWMTTGYGNALIVAILVLAFILLLPFAILPPLVRRFTWRVRNRLFLTYFLVGVLPIVLVFLFVRLAFFLVLSQTTNYLLHAELERRLEQAHSTAEDLARVFVDGRDPSFGPNGVRQAAVVRTMERTLSISEVGPLSEFPAWSKPGFKGVVKTSNGTFFLAAHAEVIENRRRAEAFYVRTLDNTLLSELLPGIASIQLLTGTTVRFRVGTSGNIPDIEIVLDSEEIAPPPQSRGLLYADSPIETASPLFVRSLEDGTTEELAVYANTVASAILKTVFSTVGESAVVLVIFLGVIALIFVLVEIAAIIASVKLARTLTGTVHDLYAGTKKVESGDFSHRIPVRSKDQLSELAASFNGMTGRIEQLIEEVKEKEKLESELEIARQVQAQLFPKEVPKLATLELAGVCNPARVVSGDYYDFIPMEMRRAAVVLGDISGKGISAALLMASVQASLHAQLAMSADIDVSTATLVARLNRQLYENTPPEKYATFYCALYNDRTGRLSYTNAGHLAPILIRNGQATRLESNGTVVGIFPEYPFEQAEIQLEPGDLLAAFTDGITESEDAREEQFGDDRLIELLTHNAGKPLDEIIQTVMNTIGKWAHDPAIRDDITMLLARKL